MEQSALPQQTAIREGRPRQPSRQREKQAGMSLRARSILYGIIAAIILILLIAIGSRGFRWFDTALIGYAVASVFAVAAVTYKYTFWLKRPPTDRYWRRSWELFLSFTNFRRYTTVVPAAIADLFAQQFIRGRSVYRWVTHQCIFWGVLLSCLITFPLTFGWLRFTQPLTANQNHLYQIWIFGFPLFILPAYSVLGFVLFHALDFTALLLFIGLIMAFHRRFHDLALIAVQRFRFDLMPLVLLMAIVISGLALTADSLWLRGAYYWYISLAHQAIVVLWLISLPFGKFFHLIERPATIGVKLYWQTGEKSAMQKCARCGEEFAPVRFIQDLKKTLYEVGENYTLRETPAVEGVHNDNPTAEEKATTTLWWQDLCPTCKRVVRAQANLAALGREGNRFL